MPCLISYLHLEICPKINNKWQPFYRVLRKTGPASYEIACEFSGDIVRTHEDKLLLANLECWDEIRTAPRPILQREEQTNPPTRILPHRRARDLPSNLNTILEE